MNLEKFPRREVERAFRKFNDLSQDLFNAKFQTWDDSLKHLVSHCEQNPVMRAVIEPLRENKNVDARKWHSDALASVRGMVGSGKYKLPIDDEDRTALLYQFFLLIDTEGLDIGKFCMAVYGSTKYQEMVNYFNQELVTKFVREVSYRLNEIVEDAGTATEIPRDAMRVFHYHDHSLNIHGNVQGSNVAVGGSTISESTAAYVTGADLAEALTQLTPLVNEIADSCRAPVNAALQTLITAAKENAGAPEQLANSIQKIAEASPKLSERLKGIGEKIGLSLVSSTIFQAIKSYFDIH